MATMNKAFIGAVEDEWQLFSDDREDYTLGAPIGFGASSIVYAAQYCPKASRASSRPSPCALKVLDLDRLPPHSLSLLQRETTLMSLSKHPNVLRVRGSWIDGHKIYIALRLMNKGSAADVMHYGWPGGMEEDVVRCILQQALLGLNYLHINGFIHRDIKAANLLIDDDGTVLLGDLGVAADLSEDRSDAQSKNRNLHSSVAIVSLSQSTSTTSSSSQHAPNKRVTIVDSTPARPKMGKRKSFVGTPCWMAPELIQGHQYDASADIWSFGITALELTQGRPPRSRDTPQKVLLKTVQDAPPTLARDGNTHKYSRAFKEVIDSCLTKDPSKRPTAEQLLQTPFFKGSKKKSYLVNTILRDLPPLTKRQERRAAPSVMSRLSVDSWDFAATVASRRLHDDLDHLEARHSAHNTTIGEGIFDLDEELENSRTRISETAEITSRSRPVSLQRQSRPPNRRVVSWLPPGDAEVTDGESHPKLSSALSQDDGTSPGSSSADNADLRSSPPTTPGSTPPSGVDIEHSIESAVETLPSQPRSAPASSVLEQALFSEHARRSSSSSPTRSSQEPESSSLWRKLTRRNSTTKQLESKQTTGDRGRTRMSFTARKDALVKSTNRKAQALGLR